MAKRPEMTKREFKKRWKNLPEADRQFIRALTLVSDAVGDRQLLYHKLPPTTERWLRRADRDTLFSIVIECLGLLTDAPAMQRIRDTKRPRVVHPAEDADARPRKRSVKKRRKKKSGDK